MADGEFTDDQKARVNEAVSKAEEKTGLEFCVIIGVRPHEDPRHAAERAFHKADMHGRPSILIMVTPSARTLEIVVAHDLADRVTDSVCDEAVQLMTGLFSTGDVVGGIERGIQLVAERAGDRSDGKTGHIGPDLPNIVDLDDTQN